MKLTLKTNTEDCLLCRINNKDYKEINLKKKYTIIFPDNTEKIEIVHSNPKKKSIVGFIILSFVCFFMESQKTFEKREFTSFYEFAKNSFVCDFFLNVKDSNINEISVFQKVKNVGKFQYLLWDSNDIPINNCISKTALKESLMELIAFWFIVLSIPILVILCVILIAYVKSNSIFELGIFLVVILLGIFIINTICFVLQYKKVLKSLN